MVAFAQAWPKAQSHLILAIFSFYCSYLPTYYRIALSVPLVNGNFTLSLPSLNPEPRPSYSAVLYVLHTHPNPPPPHVLINTSRQHCGIGRSVFETMLSPYCVQRASLIHIICCTILFKEWRWPKKSHMVYLCASGSCQVDHSLKYNKILEEIHLYNPYSGITNNQCGGFNRVMKDFQSWKEAPLDTVMVMLYPSETSSCPSTGVCYIWWKTMHGEEKQIDLLNQ